MQVSLFERLAQHGLFRRLSGTDGARRHLQTRLVETFVIGVGEDEDVSIVDDVRHNF